MITFLILPPLTSNEGESKRVTRTKISGHLARPTFLFYSYHSGPEPLDKIYTFGVIDFTKSRLEKGSNYGKHVGETKWQYCANVQR